MYMLISMVHQGLQLQRHTNQYKLHQNKEDLNALQL